MPNVRGMPPRGSFKIPPDIIDKLGEGDPKIGGAIIHQMFGIEDNPDDPTVIDPNVVRLIGHGDLAKGHKVLKRFVQMLRRQGLTAKSGSHTMKLCTEEASIVAAFGRELKRMRTHPEVAWQRAWDRATKVGATRGASVELQDRIKQTAFAAYGITHELRIKTTLPPMGAPPVDPELLAHWCDASPFTVH
jgi:hypothetical protein